MKFLHSRYAACREILETYTYPEPFALHLKQYFRNHKKFGSRDRREVSQICFTALRTAQFYKKYGIDEALMFSMHVLYPDSEEVKALVQAESSVSILGLDFKSLCNKLNLDHPFYQINLQEDYTVLEHADNFGFQPKVWLRNSNFSEAEESDLVQGAQSVEHGTNLPDSIQIQDLSSQYLCSKIELMDNGKVWDCCAASGGKSLNLSYDSNAHFYLSDSRPQIIENAKKRLRKVKQVQFAVYDAIQDESLRFDEEINAPYFDYIIADVPCSGSGTWFRNPEHFAYFNYDDVAKYREQQRAIIRSVIRFLKPGGTLYYMTCSVFKEENMEQSQYFSAEFNLKQLKSYGFCGLDYGADSMYMATFKKR
ncbi:methyltransferase domain-containing protein [bacterium]|nr:methyltransferase domain-containing protein [bacterium]